MLLHRLPFRTPYVESTLFQLTPEVDFLMSLERVVLLGPRVALKLSKTEMKYEWSKGDVYKFKVYFFSKGWWFHDG